MAYEQVRYETAHDGRIAVVTLDRPRYRNAQSRQLLEELDAAFAEAVEDTAVRVIVLRGEGESFSGGHDLGTPEETADRQERPYEQGLRGRYQRSYGLYVDFGLRWRNLPKPVIAAVQGWCINGGWMVASAADVIFAADDAKFRASLFQYFALPFDIGVRKAKEILFENRFILADEAKELGLVTEVHPVADLEAAVMAYAERVAENDSFQLRMIKLAVNQAQDAQGYSTSIVGAHTAYMLRSEAADAAGGRSLDDRRRLSDVDSAMRYSFPELFEDRAAGDD